MRRPVLPVRRFLSVRRSGIHGRGVYCGAPSCRGTILGNKR